jgi:hypothetical protein
MPTNCESCRTLARSGGGYELRKPGGVEHRCLQCSLRYQPMLRRSAKVALVVGTILTVLNHGDQLSGLAPQSAWLWWKIGLTYLVPFCVATYGSLANAIRIG